MEKTPAYQVMVHQSMLHPFTGALGSNKWEISKYFAVETDLQFIMLSKQKIEVPNSVATFSKKSGIFL